jgi:hypothetical protein
MKALAQERTAEVLIFGDRKEYGAAGVVLITSCELENLPAGTLFTFTPEFFSSCRGIRSRPPHEYNHVHIVLGSRFNRGGIREPSHTQRRHQASPRRRNR